MRSSLALLVVALCAATQIRAQDSTAADPSNTSGGADTASAGLEQVVVTARKRSENLQDTPISITAFSAQDLEQRGYADIGALQDAAPNLSITTSSPISGSANSASVFIRGIGQIDFTPNTNPGVGIYLDGVYIARSVGGVLDLVDVDSIDVLKGPQGTLFGRNTIGGAIDVKSTAPATTPGGSVSVSYGSYHAVDAKASLDLPLSDTILTKVSFGVHDTGGDVTRLNLDGSTAGHEGARHDFTARGVLEFRPNTALDVRLTIDGTSDHDENPGEVLLAANPDASFTSFYNGVIAPTLAPALGAKAYYNDQWAVGPFTTYANGQNTSNTNVLGIGLTATYDLGAVHLRSITAYRNLNSFFGRDTDSSPLAVSFTTDGYRDGALSQEFQVGGKALGEALTYVGGLYYFRELASDTNLVQFPVVYITSGGRNDNSSRAVFGQATYELARSLDLTAGLRYTKDQTLYTPDSYINSSPLPYAAFYAPGVTLAPPLIQPTYTARNRADKLSPEANVSYHWTPDVMTYINYSQGYKSGGFTQRVFPPENNIPAYGPENATVYEVGAKTTFLERRLRVNAAFFHTDYENVQITEQVGVAPTTANGGTARINGAELEIQALPLERLTLGSGIGYTHAYWTALAPGAQITLADKFAYTPLWSLSGSVSYAGRLDNGWHITPRVDASWRAAQYYDAVNSINLRQGAYGLVNASLTVAPHDSNPQFFIRVDNMFSRIYLVSGWSDLATAGLAEGLYGRPRTVWGGVRFAF